MSFFKTLSSFTNKNMGSKLRNPYFNNIYNGKVQTIILDNSGTCVDPFVIAPAIVFKEVFHKFHIDITMNEARVPMGIRKDLHIAQILEMPRVQEEFKKVYNRQSTQEDILNIYNAFIPMQLEVLPEYCNLLPKVTSTMDLLRKNDIQFGTTTGFNREMVDCIIKNTKDKGLDFNTTTACDDFSDDEKKLGSRPKPFLLWKNLFKLDTYPIQSVVKVDDTITGIHEGLNAGCWTVGISAYSNYMNVDSLEQWKNMSVKEKNEKKNNSRSKLQNESNAHYVIDEFEELIPVIEDINIRIKQGEKP